MKSLLTVITIFLFSAVHSQQQISYDSIMPLANYNFVLGTNAIGGKYQFTSDSKLYEQAKHIRAMGSNILKISLGPNSPKSYELSITQKLTNTLDLFKASPEYRKVFDMDFKYIFTWVHTLTGIEWKKGISADQEKILYDEMFNFASFLLKEYNESGKTFLIGNWEGDWLLHPNYNRNFTPTQEHIDNMTKWFQIRQCAIDDAKKQSNAKNVELYYYVELNLVLKGLKGEACIAQSILPNVNVDLVSYSSYEAIKNNRNYAEKKEQLQNVFDYLEKQLKPKAGLPFSRRVYIGEYGYHASNAKPESFKKQYEETKEIMKISLELNLPFALHWQMYNNEYETNGESKQMSLINESGKRMPLYYLHQHFYKQMNSYIKNYKAANKVDPSDKDFRKKALEVLDSITF
ncbi:hypothetical protein [Sediminibacterium sp.]|uniref:hypothetical protein n=1 Tax=Sediminibacterium sp. TaxID=1917865 RepID=UPI003F71F825